MARTAPASDESPALYRCTESFATFVDGIPLVYADGAEVLADDPILKTHPTFFEAAASRLVRAGRVERATAEPGEKRPPIVAPPAQDNGDNA